MKVSWIDLELIRYIVRKEMSKSRYLRVSKRPGSIGPGGQDPFTDVGTFRTLGIVAWAVVVLN